MSIECRCDNCGRQYLVNDKYAGKRAKCKDCGQTYVIPRLASSAPADAVKSEPMELDVIFVDDPPQPTIVRTAGPPPIPVSRTMSASVPPPPPPQQACPGCGTACGAGTVICVNCGYNFQLGTRMTTQVEAPSLAAAVRPTASRARRDAEDASASSGFNSWALTFSLFAIGAPLLPLCGRQFVLLAIFGDAAPFVGIPCGIIAAILWFNRGQGAIGVGSVIASVIALVVAIYSVPAGTQPPSPNAAATARPGEFPGVSVPTPRPNVPDITPRPLFPDVTPQPAPTPDPAKVALKAELDAAIERAKALKAELSELDRQFTPMEVQLMNKRMAADSARIMAGPHMPGSQQRYEQAVAEYNALVDQAKALETQRNAKAQEYNQAVTNVNNLRNRCMYGG